MLPKLHTPLESQMMLLGAGSSGGGEVAAPVPQNFQASGSNEQIVLSWDADSNVEYLIYVSRTNDFGTASLNSTLAAPATSLPYSTTNDLDPTTTPPSLTTGTKYYFWIAGGDGAGSPVTDPAGPVSARAYETLATSNNTTLWVPDGATLQLQDLLFSTSPIPAGFVIGFGGDTYEYISGTLWLSQTNAAPSGTLPVSGSFNADNQTGGSFTFWDTEP